MPYNTRRVSLSLPSLGIQLPGNAAATKARIASQNALANSSVPSDLPPAKRIKRSQTISSTSSSASPAPGRSRNLSSGSDRQPPTGPQAETTPPPSPSANSYGKLETAGINDDVVVAVLEQLDITGNRPHLIKELAAVLTHNLKVVESSANPTAIISSRLTNFLRRPWTSSSPCPLAKEQVAVHPRRVYYFLTTSPRQDIPEYTEDAAAIPANGRIISPSVSSGPDDEDPDAHALHYTQPSSTKHGPTFSFSANNSDPSSFTSTTFTAPQSTLAHDSSYRREREYLSPSPELDDFDLPPYAAFASPEPFQTTESRAQSPPLEHDEREFSQTACSMIARKRSEDAERRVAAQKQQQQQRQPLAHTQTQPNLKEPQAAAGTQEQQPTTEEPPSYAQSKLESEESAARANREAAAALFGQAHTQPPLLHFGSPMLRPLGAEKLALSMSTPRKHHPMAAFEEMGMFWDGAEMRSPEVVGMSELDDLLGSF